MTISIFELILTTAVGILTTATFTFIGRMFIKIKADNKLIHESLCAIMRGNIVRIHATYIPSREIPQEIYEAVCQYFEEYKKLGGNGYVDRLFKEIQQLKLI